MRLPFVGLLCTLAAAPLLAQPTVQTPPADRYYITLFGGHANVFRPRTGHTWATFTHTFLTSDGQTVAETHTVSWMPATLVIRPFAPRAETGVNLTHEQSLAFMATGGRPWVTSFGPYEITAERYEQGLAQKALLESGAIRYHGLGLFGRRDDVMHCIDAVTRTDPKWEQTANPTFANGMLGTYQAVWAMKRSGFAQTSPAHRALHPVVTPNSPVHIRER